MSEHIFIDIVALADLKESDDCPADAKEHIDAVVEYLWKDELRHYQEATGFEEDEAIAHAEAMHKKAVDVGYSMCGEPVKLADGEFAPCILSDHHERCLPDYSDIEQHGRIAEE